MESESFCNMREYDTIRNLITPHEDFFTQTYDEQDEVEEQILQVYQLFHDRVKEKDSNNGASKIIPLLERERHEYFLKKGLRQLPVAYECLDASRPWLCYWMLHSLNLLGQVIIEPEQKIQISQFLDSCQNESGGFGGGPDQYPHLAATYAAINALSSLKSVEALKVVNKTTLLEFLLKMKLKDGSFRMHVGGEVDVRAVYCAIIISKLTNTSTPDLFDGTAEWVIKCQTYEGGFGAAPHLEAHGGYTFCALSSLVLLQRVALIDLNSLERWLAMRQMPLEGGFQGRTNKLVDGCYSFWQGACFNILEQLELSHRGKIEYNSLTLQEYILICCQHPTGGLIDKPGKQKDYYHTCYALSGLSCAQHHKDVTDSKKNLLGEQSKNLLTKIHPTFNLTVDSVEVAINFFYADESNKKGYVEELMDDSTNSTPNESQESTSSKLDQVKLD